MQPDFEKTHMRVGVVWIVLCPLFLVVALYSAKGATDPMHYTPSIGFLIAALFGVVCGIGILSSRSWALLGLKLLSWVVSLYFVAMSCVLSFYAFRFPSAEGDVRLFSAGVFSALIGIPFIFMALKLRTQAR